MRQFNHHVEGLDAKHGIITHNINFQGEVFVKKFNISIA